jgi:hypothetical protein
MLTDAIGFSGAMLAVLGQSAAPVESWTQVISQYGLMGGMVLLFVYWTREREKALSERLKASEDFIRDKLIQTINANTQAFQEFTETLRENRHERALPS